MKDSVLRIDKSSSRDLNLLQKEDTDMDGVLPGASVLDDQELQPFLGASRSDFVRKCCQCRAAKGIGVYAWGYFCIFGVNGRKPFGNHPSAHPGLSGS